MRIIQISDLHVCKGLDKELCTNMFKSMAKEISICEGEEIVFCICGDFIERGSIDELPRAKEIVKEFLSYFKTDKLTVMCVPGNHDIYDTSKFELFDDNLGEICTFKTSFATNSVSKKCVLGTNTWLIGVGPFTKDVPAVSPQANVIEISPLGVEKVFSYRYNADIDKTWSQTLAESPITEFSGHSLAKVYRDAVLGVKSSSAILNFKMKVHLPYDQFCKEIQELFSDKISIAQDWQSKEVPASLYYNHGQYIWKYGDPIDFLYNELIKKPTSSRAVIPLINFGDVVNSKDNFLPSFDLLQFGYHTPSDRTLNVILYLRALEVNHFLIFVSCI